EAQNLTEQIAAIPDFEDVIFNMGDGILKGYSCLEMEWRHNGRQWTPLITHRPASWFTVSPDERDTLLLRDSSAGYGAPLRPLSWIAHKHKPKSGYITRAGLVRVLAWPFLFKNYSVRDLAELLEIYGIPVGIGKYPSGADSDEKKTLLHALVSIGHNARGIIPEGMMIDFLEAAKGNADPFQLMIDWCERSVSKAILGGTLTSQADGKTSTNALGNVHNEVRWELTVSDAQQFNSTLTRDLVFPLRVLNGKSAPDPARPFQFKFDVARADDLAAFASGMLTLKQAGMGPYIPVSYIQKRLLITAPKDDEPTLGGSENIPPQDAASLLAALKAGQGGQDEFDEFADELAGDWERVTAPVLNPVFDLLEQAKDIHDFRRQLPQIITDMDTGQLSETLANAFFNASI
ncbi:MAG: DUF935 family protein, partial [Gammaproteobacteria bacterium]|nr:DUF935 family protein [Gammaproteobacteria bacterium]